MVTSYGWCSLSGLTTAKTHVQRLPSVSKRRAPARVIATAKSRDRSLHKCVCSRARRTTVRILCVSYKSSRISWLRHNVIYTAIYAVMRCGHIGSRLVGATNVLVYFSMGPRKGKRITYTLVQNQGNNVYLRSNLAELLPSSDSRPPPHPSPRCWEPRPGLPGSQILLFSAVLRFATSAEAYEFRGTTRWLEWLPA